ncbi:MAG: SGNH/GDSL hydrolase family protein [Hyphomicrobiales bacterium]|nr:SGNH/GDSL hydrolase family protein [Hyphomicrobiales bacterium]MCP4997731.1 SGNH/GDSL hydrolase family protein [Hyphomicrobiales bacterium]
MKYLVYSVASWLLLPVALVQGLRMRARTPRLLPPDGRPFGQFGSAPEPAYRILVVGDSSAAGVGADDVRETVGCQIAHILNEQTGAMVSWRNAGANSAISEEVRDHVVPNLERLPYTHIILTVGTNDMKNFLTARRFKNGFGGLLYALKAKWPQATIIWSPMIDMRMVPGLPTALSHILQMRAKIINRVGHRLCRERYAIAAPQLVPVDKSGFSADGFHACGIGYRYWAELLAHTILETEDIGRDAADDTAKAAE